MATITSPITHAQMDGGSIQFRQAFILLPGAVRLRLMDVASIRTDGAILNVGDLAGTGSDTIRTRYYSSIGYGATMTQVAETDTPARASIAAEVEDIQIARYHIGYSQTYQDIILRGQGEIDLEGLAARIVENFEATWMAKLAAVVANAAADYGVSGVDMSFDDLLDVTGYFRTLDGFDDMPLWGLLHGQQIEDLRRSTILEPNFQFPEPTREMLQRGGPGFKFEMLGAKVVQSGRITSAGGNRHGAFFGPGAIGWAIAGTSALAPHVEDPERAQIIPELGMVCERASSGNGAAATMDTNAWFGMDILDDSQLRGMVTDA